MRIAILNASSQKMKNGVLFEETKYAIQNKKHEAVNLGVFPEESEQYSYVQIALCASILLESKAVDFVITGCSSGTGMMLACNSLPGVLCGYISTPADAYLFGRINDGNAISYPLGLNYGWAGELNLRYTLEKLFEEPFGIGYPAKDAKRKRNDTDQLKKIKGLAAKKLVDIIPELDRDFVQPLLARDIFYSYFMENGQDENLKLLLQKLK